jgi:MarR family transcriptional regulator, 2-MHQ and catechol-resistance regulon repressor
MSHDSSRQRLALLTYSRLTRAANSLRAQASRQLDGTGLTLSQFAVLEALYHLGPMSLSEVAKKILTTGGNLTMVAGNLEKQGLVSRKCSTEDARVYILSLTPKGKKLIGEVFPEHAAAITSAFEALTPKEQKKLAELCRNLELKEEIG